MRPTFDKFKLNNSDLPQSGHPTTTAATTTTTTTTLIPFMGFFLQKERLRSFDCICQIVKNYRSLISLGLVWDLLIPL